MENRKSDDASRLGELYDQNRGLLWKLAMRYGDACARDRGVDVEDLVQAGFFGLVKARESFDPEAGKGWVSWAAWYIVREFNTALGIREGKARRAHTGAVSLDEPLPGDEDGDSSRLDTLADESLPDPDAAIIEGEHRAAIQAAMARLRADRAEAVQLHDLQCMTYAQVSEHMGTTVERARQLRTNAFRDLRYDRKLKMALDEETRFHTHKGVTAFLSDWTSVTEEAALWRIERQHHFTDAVNSKRG